jgi:transposase
MQDQTVTRQREFRQLKEKIRGSETHLIVGIDVAKEKHHAFFGTATGKTLFKRLIFDNDLAGLEKLLLQAEAIRIQNGLEQVVFALEPTANYHKPLGEFLIKQGHTVVLAGSGAVKNNRELLDGRWDKHDTKDAANVADLISQGKFLYYDYPSPAVRELRSLLSFKRRLRKQDHGLRMRIRNHLVAQYFPEFDKVMGNSLAENLAIVKWCLAPAEIAARSFTEFFKMVTSRDRGAAQQRRLRTIWEMARSSIGCEVGEAAKFEAAQLVDSLKNLRHSMEQVDARIKEICLGLPEYECLLSIPGFGPAISAATLGAIGDPFRFKSGSQVLKLAGVDLSASRSGKNSQSITPALSKKGKSDLRYALYQAAVVAANRNKDFIRYFTAQLQGRERERGIRTKMLVKLAAKMLIIAWTLMKKRERFDPARLQVRSKRD